MRSNNLTYAEYYENLHVYLEVERGWVRRSMEYLQTGTVYNFSWDTGNPKWKEWISKITRNLKDKGLFCMYKA